MSVAEIPCRYYAYPTTEPQGVCLIMRFAVKNFSRLGAEKKFPPVRPSPLVDLRVTLRKSGAYLFLYAENKVDEHVLNLDATTTISNDNGDRLYREVRECIELEGKTDILPWFDCALPEPLPNDSLVLDIKFDIFNLSGEGFEECDNETERETEAKFSEDLKNWILEELPDEVILKTADDFIQVNKAILCARSPVFRRMFQHPMRERTSQIVPIDDVDGAALKTLVEFMCYGKANLSEIELESLEELYYAADKYDVLDLRQICAQTMLSRLTEENASGVLVLAYRHADQYLLSNCMIFLHACIQSVMETKGWVHLKASDPYLAVDVLEACLKGNRVVSIN